MLTKSQRELMNQPTFNRQGHSRLALRLDVAEMVLELVHPANLLAVLGQFN